MDSTELALRVGILMGYRLGEPDCDGYRRTDIYDIDDVPTDWLEDARSELEGMNDEPSSN